MGMSAVFTNDEVTASCVGPASDHMATKRQSLSCVQTSNVAPLLVHTLLASIYLPGQLSLRRLGLPVLASLPCCLTQR